MLGVDLGVGGWYGWGMEDAQFVKLVGEMDDLVHPQRWDMVYEPKMEQYRVKVAESYANPPTPTKIVAVATNPTNALTLAIDNINAENDEGTRLTRIVTRRIFEARGQ